MTDALVGEKRNAHDPRSPSPGPSHSKRFKSQTDSVIEDSTMEEGVEELGNAKEPGSSTKRSHGRPRPKPERTKDKESKKDGRHRRRQLPNEEDANKVDEATGQEEGPKPPRYPKRQCALLVGFCGSGYSGMQIQPSHTRTIEGALFGALVKVGAVSQDNADDPVKVALARAARTDAGVHAAGNLVSLKMIITVPGIKDLVARINEELPPEIRLWGYVRTQNSFNARLVCDSRKYTYFFPTYLMIPPKPGTGLHRVLQLPSQPHSFWEGAISDSFQDDLRRKRCWRTGQEQVQKLRELAKGYEGTHNFHNFTVGREFKERSNHRFMKQIEVSDPVVYGDTEWISVMFHGQSFMLHQIRKMMSMLVMTCRTETSPQIIDELYGPRNVFVPKMPSLGLLLEHPLFHSYNGRMAVINEKLQPSDAEYRPLIDFELHREKIDAFKEEYIYKNMREVEGRDGLFDAWIRAVDSYAGDDLLYLNREGIIPLAAVIKKGERRENPFREKKIFDATSFPVADEVKKQLEEQGEAEDEDLVVDKGQPFSPFTLLRLVCALAKRMNPDIIQHVGEEFMFKRNLSTINVPAKITSALSFTGYMHTSRGYVTTLCQILKLLLRNPQQ